MKHIIFVKNITQTIKVYYFKTIYQINLIKDVPIQQHNNIFIHIISKYFDISLNKYYLNYNECGICIHIRLGDRLKLGMKIYGIYSINSVNIPLVIIYMCI